MATMIKVLEVQVGNKDWTREANCFNIRNKEKLISKESFGALISKVLKSTDAKFSLDPYGSTNDYYLDVTYEDEKLFGVIYKIVEVPDYKYEILRGYEKEQFR